ncbi:MAG: putative iron-regulated membrane protein [Alteromonadaceae bacterium]|jgi:uncharacterized iron-regulated membrane protein
MLKTYLRRCHLLLALISGLFLLSLSMSGAVLLYAKDIQRLVNPQFWLLEPQEIANKPLLLLSELTEQVTTNIHKKIKYIEKSDAKNVAWQIRLQDNSYASINPYNGDTLLRYQFTDTLYGFTMAWHRWLLYSDKNNEKPFKVLMSIASLILIIEIIIGVYLWAKPKHRIKRMKIRWQAKNKILLHQLHTTLGVICCLPLILIAFSGMAFNWKEATQGIVEWLTFSEIENHQTKQKNVAAIAAMPNAHFNTKSTNALVNLDLAYTTAQTQLKEGQVLRIYLPQKPTEPLALRIKMPAESHAYSWSWSDASSGKFLDSFNATQTSIATQVWNFKYKFHIGEFIGWPIKVLWLFLSILPSFFMISGCYLWLKRKNKMIKPLAIIKAKNGSLLLPQIRLGKT